MSTAGDSTPIRTCVGCRATSAQGRLLRFARRADGHVIPANVTRDVAGRTAYLCPRRSCLDQALKRRAFTRAFGAGRRRVSVIDVDAAALWTATADQLRREIDLLARTSDNLHAEVQPANPHVHPRRRGLEQLLSELSSQPTPPQRSASKRGLAQPHSHQPRARSVGPANDEPQEGGAPSHG